MPTDVSDDLSKHPVGTGLSDLVKTLTPYPIPVILGPNIIGAIGPFRMWATKVDPQNEALFAENRGNCGWASTGGDLTINIRLDASKGNAKYSSDTIQPTSAYTLIIIRA